MAQPKKKKSKRTKPKAELRELEGLFKLCQKYRVTGFSKGRVSVSFEGAPTRSIAAIGDVLPMTEEYYDEDFKRGHRRK